MAAPHWECTQCHWIVYFKMVTGGHFFVTHILPQSEKKKKGFIELVLKKLQPQGQQGKASVYKWTVLPMWSVPCLWKTGAHRVPQDLDLLLRDRVATVTTNWLWSLRAEVKSEYKMLLSHIELLWLAKTKNKKQNRTKKVYSVLK